MYNLMAQRTPSETRQNSGPDGVGADENSDIHNARQGASGGAGEPRPGDHGFKTRLAISATRRCGVLLLSLFTVFVVVVMFRRI